VVALFGEHEPSEIDTQLCRLCGCESWWVWSLPERSGRDPFGAERDAGAQPKVWV